MRDFEKSILVIQAHPDDTEAWCSGTLKLLADKGFKISIATMTGGGLGGVDQGEQETAELRKGEAARAAEVLGARYYCLDEPDGYLFDSREVRLKTLELIRKVRPGVVMTHTPSDYHGDHRATCSIVDMAAMQATLINAPVEGEPMERTPLLYHTAPMSLRDALGDPIAPPQFFVDITSVAETKKEMLSYHQSQLKLMKQMYNMDNFFEEALEYNKTIGKMCGKEYAECFWQHLSGGFETVPFIQEHLEEYIEVNHEFK